MTTSENSAIVKNGEIEMIEAISVESDIEERETWGNWSLQNLNQCYGEDEPEYSLEHIKEHNICKVVTDEPTSCKSLFT